MKSPEDQEKDRQDAADQDWLRHIRESRLSSARGYSEAPEELDAIARMWVERYAQDVEFLLKKLDDLQDRLDDRG
jgi:hypothetical protein